jgi:hypothetical protein
MKTFFKSIAPSLLILLFVYAAASKLINFSQFHDQLYNQAFSRRLADVLLYVVPFAELLTVGMLLIRETIFIGLLLSLLLLTLFSGYILLVLLGLWPNESCPCGGILNGMSWPIHLLFNYCFIVLNLITISAHVEERRPVTSQ